MKGLNCVRGLQILLAIFGFDFGFTGKGFLRLVLKFLLVIWISLSSINSIYMSYNIMQSTALNSVLARLIQLPPYWFYWIFFHWLLIRIPKIISFFKSLTNHLSGEELDKCYKISYFVLISLINPLSRLVWITIFSNQILIFYKTYHGIDGFIGMLIHQLFFEFVLMWPAIASSIYILAQLILFKSKMNIFSSIKNGVITSGSSSGQQNFFFNNHSNRNSIVKILPLVKILNHFEEVSSLDSQFESNLSFLPFLLLSDLFFAFSRFIFAAKLSSSYTMFIYLFLDSITAMLPIFFVNYFKNSFQEIIDDTKNAVNSNIGIDLVSKLLIIGNLKECSNHTFSGWNMFTIEPSLVLSFSSSLITFTILFLSV